MNTKEQTARALLALMSDLRNLEESAERVRIQLIALAKRHGITPVPRDAAA